MTTSPTNEVPTMTTTDQPTPAPTTTAPTTADATREVVVDLPDGRVVAATDQGPLDGPVVVFLHAAPGSRAFDPDPAATGAAGVRLITIDRAGYGDSSPIAEGTIPSVADQADATAAVLAHLGIRDAALAGWSGGGRVAIATAARHPELARRVALVATPAPDDQVPWVSDEYRAMADDMRRDPAAAVATITAVFVGAGDPTADGDAGEAAASDEGALTDLVTAGGGVDADLLASDPGIRSRVERMLAVGFAHGPAGVATDIVADQVVPWGFDVASVGVPVTLVYGEDDAVLTPDHGRWYADQLVDAELRVVAGAGHLVVVTEWSAILEALLAP